MSKEEIIALVNAKIAGQGSAVDVGGALPAILNGLAELAGNPISPDMPESEQMEVRKNLGLYYEETTTGEKTAKYTDETFVMGMAKISNDAPAKEDIIDVKSDGTSIEFSVVEDGNGIFRIEDSSLNGIFYVVAEEGTAPFTSPGIYIPEGYGDYELVYNGETTVVSKVPAKYLPIAWNQLVTGGTKIAELTIGEETTDVFAPQGGGGSAEFVEVTGLPENGMGTYELEQIGFTSDVMLKLSNGEYAGFIYNNWRFPIINKAPSSAFAFFIESQFMHISSITMMPTVTVSTVYVPTVSGIGALQPGTNIDLTTAIGLNARAYFDLITSLAIGVLDIYSSPSFYSKVATGDVIGRPFFILTDGKYFYKFEGGSAYDVKFTKEKIVPEGMPIIHLLKIPAESEPISDITEYFSGEDAEKLFGLQSNFAVYDDDFGITFNLYGTRSVDPMAGTTYQVYFSNYTGGTVFMFTKQVTTAGTTQYGVQMMA